MAVSVNHVIKTWAIQDSFLEQSWLFTAECCKVMNDTCGSCAFAPGTDIICVTTK